MLFLQPNNKFATVTQDMRDSEWHHFVSSQEPCCLNSEVSFFELQNVYVDTDAVQTVINCVQSTYEQNVQKALRLGVIFLERKKAHKMIFKGSCLFPQASHFFSTCRESRRRAA